ncbi:hypothetical protein QMS86_06360 [Cronobacter dublinensis]|uniref:hypothetical protein n=1 Tax=Cronobacter dublinensis TaxID=413497 RepID=UPI003ADCF977
MSDLTLQEFHHYCLNTTQEIINGFGWGNISVGSLSEEDKDRLAAGIEESKLNWAWGMEHYRGTANNDGILDVSLKIIDHDDPGSLHAVIICKYNARREEFAICMLENLIAAEETPLTGNVFTIALVYATTFCGMLGLEEVYIDDPIQDAQARYRSYGFAFVFDAYNKMSSTVVDIQDKIRRKVVGIGFDEE